MGAWGQPARLVGGWLSLEVGKSVETQQRALASSHSSKSGGFDPDLAHAPVRVMCSRGDCMARSRGLRAHTLNSVGQRVGGRNVRSSCPLRVRTRQLLVREAHTTHDPGKHTLPSTQKFGNGFSFQRILQLTEVRSCEATFLLPNRTLSIYTVREPHCL